MACGITLKRPLELDAYLSPEGVKRPRTTTGHCSPFRPAFTVSTVSSSSAAHSHPSPIHGSGTLTSSNSSPFHNVSTRLSSEQLESYLRAEIRYLRRRRLIPRRSRGAGGQQNGSASYRSPSSPNSSDSDGETQSFHMDKAGGSEHREAGAEKPQFTFNQVQIICDRLLREQEARLRSDYEGILSTKLAEQYETFVKFTQDQIHRQIDNGTASYLS